LWDIEKVLSFKLEIQIRFNGMKRINKGYNKEKKYNIEERRFSGLRKDF
jgi:hypothetical protein